jgi:hypothetical protein
MLPPSSKQLKKLDPHTQQHSQLSSRIWPKVGYCFGWSLECDCWPVGMMVGLFTSGVAWPGQESLGRCTAAALSVTQGPRCPAAKV